MAAAELEPGGRRLQAIKITTANLHTSEGLDNMGCFQDDAAEVRARYGAQYIAQSRVTVQIVCNPNTPFHVALKPLINFCKSYIRN